MQKPPPGYKSELYTWLNNLDSDLDFIKRIIRDIGSGKRSETDGELIIRERLDLLNLFLEIPTDATDRYNVAG
jgi:hypothetical protein